MNRQKTELRIDSPPPPPLRFSNQPVVFTFLVRSRWWMVLMTQGRCSPVQGSCQTTSPSPTPTLRLPAWPTTEPCPQISATLSTPGSSNLNPTSISVGKYFTPVTSLLPFPSKTFESLSQTWRWGLRVLTADWLLWAPGRCGCEGGSLLQSLLPWPGHRHGSTHLQRGVGVWWWSVHLFPLQIWSTLLSYQASWTSTLGCRRVMVSYILLLLFDRNPCHHESGGQGRVHLPEVGIGARARHTQTHGTEGESLAWPHL